MRSSKLFIVTSAFAMLALSVHWASADDVKVPETQKTVSKTTKPKVNAPTAVGIGGTGGRGPARNRAVGIGGTGGKGPARNRAVGIGGTGGKAAIPDTKRPPSKPPA
jgi:hypothetical protein